MFDLYSCFPSAVEIACQEMGIAEDDPRGLTVTGGLPYFGGPGNNYVTHSICRNDAPAARDPGASAWSPPTATMSPSIRPACIRRRRSRALARESPEVLQAQLDALPKPPFTEQPSGRATIETYTVMHGRKGPEYGVIVGRLNATGERFIANTPTSARCKTFRTATAWAGPGPCSIATA